jgi:hypothetical protein
MFMPRIIRLAVLLCTIAHLPLPCGADQPPIGYLLLPEAKRLDVKREGPAKPVVVGGSQGEVWHSNESHRKELRKFDVYAEPALDAERIVSVDVSHAPMEILAASPTGRHDFDSIEAAREFEEGKRKLLVFQKQGDWVMVQFLNHEPWRGRVGWIQLGPNTGGVVSYVSGSTNAGNLRADGKPAH